MIIYKDIISGDELISDSFDVKEVEDGAMLEVDCKKISIGGESINIGGNPSAEGGDEEGADDAAQQVDDVPHSFRLQSLGEYQKPAYRDHLKVYFKKVKEGMKKAGKSEEEIKEFEQKAAPVAKKIMSKINEYEFYTGESLEPDSMLIPFYFRGEAHSPTAMFWKHGMKEEKV